RSNPGAYA
ncbi:hypothetical protein ACN38_g12894, partial [Penicillium nordicum]